VDDDRVAHRVASNESDLFQIRKDERNCEGLRLEQGLLHILRVLHGPPLRFRLHDGAKRITHRRHQTEVTFLFQLCFDDLEASSRGLAYGLDEQALTDPKLNARVIWAQLQMHESTD
jgi:hypothetical protein